MWERVNWKGKEGRKEVGKGEKERLK